MSLTTATAPSPEPREDSEGVPPAPKRRVRLASPTALLLTLRAGLAVLLASSALSGVVGDTRWVLPAALTVALVTAVGLVGRGFAWWPGLVSLLQLGSLALGLHVLFSGPDGSVARGLSGFLPTGASVNTVLGLLGQAMHTVQTGLPPVAADPSLQCLICLGLGVVLLGVDALTVLARVPAVAGLLLLGVVALPAALGRTMLPWWAFAAAALGFALLLVRATSNRVQAAAVTTMAAVMALAVGFTTTAVGTEGRLPGVGSAGYGTGTDGLGLRPFTSLRGQLDREQVVDLFRVRGLPANAYLRALTLRKFDPARGFELDGLTQGVAAHEPLPWPAATQAPSGNPTRVQIEPLGYRDPWLPTFGTPTRIGGIGPEWRYDPAAGIVFTQAHPESRAYTEELVLPEPSAEELRAASSRPARTGPPVVGDVTTVDPAFLDTTGVTPEIHALAKNITAGQRTDFDKAVALKEFFTNPENGFRYQLTTGPAQSTSALQDFLFSSKNGYCEQFASAMAVLLRSEGIPSRVAVGFTSGYRDNATGERVITTDDAHAWVEAYFPGVGWTTFDPTPLTDGRATTSGYQPAPPPVTPGPAPGQAQPPAPAAPQPSTAPSAADWDHRSASQNSNAGVLGWLLVAAGLAGAGLLATPLVLRLMRRRTRLAAITRADSRAAGQAWREVVDTAVDHRIPLSSTQTVRQTAQTLIEEAELGADARTAVRNLADAVEREWYAPSSAAGTTPGSAQLPDSKPHSASGNGAENPLSTDSISSIRTDLAQSRVLPWTDQLIPRSVLGSQRKPAPEWLAHPRAYWSKRLRRRSSIR